MNISIKKKLTIVGIGSIGSLLILLMIETLFAQILTDFIIGHISNNNILFIIIIGLFLLTMVISIIVGYFFVGDLNKRVVVKSSVISLECLLLFLFIISNSSLLINYPDVYSNIHGFEILPIFPQVLVYFSIYILNNVFNLFIMEIIVYYLFFIFFLEKISGGKVVD